MILSALTTPLHFLMVSRPTLWTVSRKTCFMFMCFNLRMQKRGSLLCIRSVLQSAGTLMTALPVECPWKYVAVTLQKPLTLLRAVSQKMWFTGLHLSLPSPAQSWRWTNVAPTYCSGFQAYRGAWGKLEFWVIISSSIEGPTEGIKGWRSAGEESESCMCYLSVSGSVPRLPYSWGRLHMASSHDWWQPGFLV